jgi:HEAT repeat protein
MTDEMVINGRTIGPDSDLKALIKEQLSDGSVLASRYDETPEQGLWSLFRAANGTKLENSLVEAVKTLLTDADPSVRASAVGLAQAYSEKFAAQDLLSILDRNPQMFERVGGSQEQQQDLAWRLIRAMAGASNWTPEVRNRLRKAVQDPENGLTVLAGVVSRDPDWVISHVQEVISDQPARAEIVLFRLREPELRERLVRALPRESPRLRQIMGNAIRKEINDEHERRKLLDFLRTG